MRILISFFLIILLSIGCNQINNTNNFLDKKTEPFSEELYSILLKYQMLYPIQSNTKGNSLPIYKAIFYKNNSDTLLEISISNSGISILDSAIIYGVYSDSVLRPLIIIDSKEYLSKIFLKNPKLDSTSLHRYLPKENKEYRESHPPIFIYRVQGETFRLNRIDTVWEKW